MFTGVTHLPAETWCGRSVNNPVQVQTSGITVTDSQGVVIQHGRPGAVQNVNITQTFNRQVTEFAELLRQRLPEVDSDADAGALSDEIEAAAKDDDPKYLRVALSKAQLAIAGAVGTAVGNDLWGALLPLLRHVGLG